MADLHTIDLEVGYKNGSRIELRNNRKKGNTVNDIVNEGGSQINRSYSFDDN